MSAATGKQSAIQRLLGLLSKPQHPYRPSTQVFLDLDVNRLASDLQLVERGTERGAANRPAEDAQTFDDVEHQVVERIEGHKQDAHALYLDHLHTYDERMTALNFEDRFIVIRQAAPEAVGEFRAEAGLGRDELFELRRRLYEAEQHREQFRRVHSIIRPAQLPTLGKTLLKSGVLAVMLVIEVAINGSFLAESNLGGILGGFVQAAGFAALNIVGSFLWGLGPIRLANRRFGFAKLIGWLSVIGYLGFAIALNLTLAHLREMPASATSDIEHEALVRLTNAPFHLEEVKSWVLFGIGFVFSLIAVADGVLFTDPHFGYASLERGWIGARKQYTDHKDELLGRLRDVRDEASEAMNGASRDLSVRRGEYDTILQARSRLGQRFNQHQQHIERACNALLTTYREANRKARNSPAPGYFARPYVVEKIIYADGGPDPSARDELRKSILEAQELLKGQIEAIYAAFQQAADSYREIDDFIPENMSGTASKTTA